MVPRNPGNPKQSTGLQTIDSFFPRLPSSNGPSVIAGLIQHRDLPDGIRFWNGRPMHASPNSSNPGIPRPALQRFSSSLANIRQLFPLQQPSSVFQPRSSGNNPVPSRPVPIRPAVVLQNAFQPRPVQTSGVRPLYCPVLKLGDPPQIRPMQNGLTVARHMPQVSAPVPQPKPNQHLALSEFPDDDDGDLGAFLEEYETRSQSGPSKPTENAVITLDDSLVDDFVPDEDFLRLVDETENAATETNSVQRYPQVLAPCKPPFPLLARGPPSEPRAEQQGGSRSLQPPLEIPKEPVVILDELPASTQVPENLEELPGFDVDAGLTWIYPTTYPVRDYQYNIVQKALFRNTLVVLPTGLGKTFIAAVVMYNYYRWYPNGKVIFMAPTRPLVAQQMKACYEVMGIPQHEMVEMTGSLLPERRTALWSSKRVFFLTPQIAVNDMDKDAFSAADIKCLVVDEAHKATGAYAYCNIVRLIETTNKQFRILALSATPGNGTMAIQMVIKNLLIAHIEIRQDESLDIIPYVHKKTQEKFVLKMDAQFKSVCDSFFNIMAVHVEKLKKLKVIPAFSDTRNLSQFAVLNLRNQFQADNSLSGNAKWQAIKTFNLLISMYHAFDLLLFYGLRPFYQYVHSTLGSGGQNAADMGRDADFVSVVTTVKDILQMDLTGGAHELDGVPGNMGRPYVYGHPKLKKLEELVLEHFQQPELEIVEQPTTSTSGGARDFGKDSRVIVFTTYRDSVQEIAEMLERHAPLVRVMIFVGQSGTTRKGLTQKEQIEAIQNFRSGSCNVLVATSVGEEGLDIGEVDLIICFDAQKSPIRNVQRTGRTGRKRQGRSIILLTEGKEEQKHRQCQSTKTSNQKTLMNVKAFTLYDQNPRMVPMGLTPICVKLKVSLPAFDNKKESVLGKRRDSGDLTKWLVPSSAAKRQTTRYQQKYLTDEEFIDWNRFCKIPAEEVPVLPKTKFLYNPATFDNLCEKFRDGRVYETEERLTPQLHLNNFSSWQVLHQITFGIRHSVKANNFVAVMRQLGGYELEGDQQYTSAPKGEPFKDMPFSDDVISVDTGSPYAAQFSDELPIKPDSIIEINDTPPQKNPRPVEKNKVVSTKLGKGQATAKPKKCIVEVAGFVPSKSEAAVLEVYSCMIPLHPRQKVAQRRLNCMERPDVEIPDAPVFRQEELEKMLAEIKVSVRECRNSVFEQPEVVGMQMTDSPRVDQQMTDAAEEQVSLEAVAEEAEYVFDDWEPWDGQAEPVVNLETSFAAQQEEDWEPRDGAFDQNINAPLVGLLPENDHVWCGEKDMPAPFVIPRPCSVSPNSRSENDCDISMVSLGGALQLINRTTVVVPETPYYQIKATQRIKDGWLNQDDLAGFGPSLCFDEALNYDGANQHINDGPCEPFGHRQGLLSAAEKESGYGASSRRPLTTGPLSFSTPSRNRKRVVSSPDVSPVMERPKLQRKQSPSRIEETKFSGLDDDFAIPSSFPEESAFQSALKAEIDNTAKPSRQVSPAFQLDFSIKQNRAKEMAPAVGERSYLSMQIPVASKNSLAITAIGTYRQPPDLHRTPAGNKARNNSIGNTQTSTKMHAVSSVPAREEIDAVKLRSFHKPSSSLSEVKASPFAKGHSRADESEVVFRGRRRPVAAFFATPSTGEKSGRHRGESDSSDDDFESPFRQLSPQNRRGNVLKVADRPKRRKNCMNEFLDLEAEVSQDFDCSGDELVEEDCYPSSFVTMSNSADEYNPTYMQAAYVRPFLRSPDTQEVLRRLGPRKMRNTDILSQSFEQDSDYGDDSFVSYSYEETPGGKPNKKQSKRPAKKSETPVPARGWRSDFRDPPKKSFKKK